VAVSLFPTPPTVNSPDNAENTYAMATRIEFLVAGTIVGVRFWGATNNISTSPVARVYTTGGADDSTQAFVGPFLTAAWNTVTLSTPVHVNAGEQRDITVGPRNRYAANTGQFTVPFTNGNLRGHAGRFIVSAASPPPHPTTSTTTWYGVDVLFEPDVTGTMTMTLPALGSEFSGEVSASGTLELQLPGIIVDAVGLVTVGGVLEATLPSVTVEMAGASAAGGNIVGPCGWIIPEPLCCDGWDDVPAAIQSSARDYAALILWAATGRQYGLCTVSVRPCGMQKCVDGLVAFYGYDYSGGTWVPYVFDGVWYNCSCPGRCSCTPRCQIRLMGPVDSITEVTIGGIAVDPDTYRVDDNHWLVRTDGECWPECVDIDTDDGDNVLVVTYVRGGPVPAALLRAASTLACEWAKACTGGDCRLSNRVTSVARNGITIDMAAPEQLLEGGLTGLWEVDSVIQALNPFGRKSRGRIYAPELKQPRMITSP
jgi:hypothetical protein